MNRVRSLTFKVDGDRYKLIGIPKRLMVKNPPANAGDAG